MIQIELDDIDIGILAFLTDVPDSTTSDIAKAIFKPPYSLRKLDSFLRYRLQLFVAEGIVKQYSKARKNRYLVDPKKVLFGDGVLRLDGIGEVEMGYFIVVKKENETVAKSIDDYERRLGKKIFSEQNLISARS